MRDSLPAPAAAPSSLTNVKDYETVQIRIAAIVDLMVAANRVDQGLARVPDYTDAHLITGASLITLGELRALMRAIRAVDPRHG